MADFIDRGLYAGMEQLPEDKFNPEINKYFNLLRNEQKLINGMNKYLKYLVEN